METNPLGHSTSYGYDADNRRTSLTDWQAVVEGVKQPWSQDQVEGQVNRLKAIKHQMFGRAKFDLLRQRVLRAKPA